jgi:hypothetical protein
MTHKNTAQPVTGSCQTEGEELAGNLKGKIVGIWIRWEEIFHLAICVLTIIYLIF